MKLQDTLTFDSPWSFILHIDLSSLTCFSFFTSHSHLLTSSNFILRLICSLFSLSVHIYSNLPFLGGGVLVPLPSFLSIRPLLLPLLLMSLIRVLSSSSVSLSPPSPPTRNIIWSRLINKLSGGVRPGWVRGSPHLCVGHHCGQERAHAVRPDRGGFRHQHCPRQAHVYRHDSPLLLDHTDQRMCRMLLWELRIILR